MMLKTCRVCQNAFSARNTLERVCGFTCAVAYGKEKVAKKKKKETSQMRKDMNAKDRSYQLKKSQEAFNAFIRERDKHLPCISSGRTTGQAHAGHYKSIGSHPELRFDEQNCNKQSMKDNSWLSGNIAGYRLGLIEKYGIESVERLEGPHEPKNYTLDEIVEIKTRYRAKLKQIRTEETL